ncbi:piezo-type mechanosensitive ion channel component 2-like isoform X1 [Stegostoma tigrinum]|uniref:piezo-type mechanosensitive ion channel component 2-like isoform X1 n=1 Tax=Stegostoma tigrinum TaxID=3053191 RepID=UPI00202B5F0D|nr:piezo-type mechanosensitive ion channel component 2-like isoform X1 [Stegostoma tigrinum]
MASEVVCGLIFRLLLPICLVAACLFRYNGLSFVYLIFLLLIPLFSEPTKKTMQGHTGRLLKTLCFTSLTFLLLHALFQITIYSLQANEKIKPDFNCTDWEKSFRQIGFESVNGADAGNIIRLFAPDVGMFVAGLATWLVCKSLVQQPPSMDMAQYNPEFQNEEQVEEKLELADTFIYEEDFEVADVGEELEEEGTKQNILRRIATYASKLKEFIGNIIATTGKVVVTILLGLTGITLPSLSSGVYFFVFLGLCTWWSCGKQFDPLIFSCLCVLMAIFSAGHLIGLYLYQLQFLQELIPPGDFYARLFGVSPVIQTNCTTTWKIIANPNMSWPQHVNPIMLLLLYYTLATLIRLWLQEPIIRNTEEESYNREEEEQKEPFESDSSVSANMRRNMWYSAHYATDERRLLTITQDDTNSSDALLVTVNGNPVDYHNMHSAFQAENGPTTLEMYSTPQYKWEMVDESPDKTEDDRVPEETVNSRLNSLITIFRFIMKQSYICALIAMMAWSITYHSWLTFVLLIWSCILWMVRNRRRYAMLTSPFMVFYGNVLLTLQYIWSLDLTEEELPQLSGVLQKMKTTPCVELSSKILCALTFWLLLRQYITERREAKKLKESALSEVKVEELDDGQQGKEIMKVFGTLVMGMFVKYWIYVCGGMFFFVSFEGKIVMYKIIYMMLFLFCVALYQVHYDWWRRILKYFWIIVVSYTMLVLILVYTYQFKSFPDLWQNMTGMDIEKLKDLGLEQFSVADLFTSIFIPTSFLLVCILHLHYFHDRFLELTDLKAVTSKQESSIYSHAKVNGRVYLLVNRLVNPDGSLPDIGMMNLNTSAQKEERVDAKQPNEGDEDDEDDEEEDDEDCTEERNNKWHLVIDRLTVLFLKFMETFHKLQVMAWWILELHIIKIVSFYIIWITLKEVSLLNYVFLISWAFALPFVKLRPLASSVCTVMTCIIIVCKMLYQLSSVQPSNHSSNCTIPQLNETNVESIEKLKKSVLYASPVDPANWIGLRKSSPLLVYLKNNLLILAVLAFEVTIYRHQEYFRLRNNLPHPVTKTIFHDITRQHLDNGLVNCAKYFINYFFYKFGLEICFLMTVNVIGQRMDVYAMLHAFWLFALLYRRRRKAIAEIWPKYCCFLACILTFQYLLCIGIPPAACKEYPWRYASAKINSNFIKWLYFPDFITNPNPMFLIYDFMMLLCASLQWQVFEDENRAAVRIVAGDNVEICRDLDAATFSQHNPVPDFIHCRSYLDMIKVIGFSYLFWFVLTIIFITGTTRISIFCMGYLVACFYFLLFGGELLLKPIKIILQYWDCLIAYNVFVITMKNILSIGACAYINSLILKSCWLIQTFGLVCTVKGYDQPPAENLKKCPLPKDEAGIIWDSICFSFLLLQRRVFMSYYFLHVVADIKSAQILASRGAELFQATIVKAVKARLEEEKKSMDQLKRQMDRIKTRQQKYKKGKERMLSLTQSADVQGPQMKQEDDDDDDEGEPEKDKAKGKKKQWWRPWVDHASMVRSGDYYLFETDSEEENEEEVKEDEEEQPKKSGFQRAVRKFASAIIALPKSILKLPKTILQLIVRAIKFIYHTWMKDSKSVLKGKEKNKRKGWENSKKETGGHIAIECEETEELPTPEEVHKHSNAPDNVFKRVFNLLKFTWVLFLALVDSFTKWLNSISKECIDISTVLRIERCMLTREVKKGNVPCRDSIHNYYKHQMKMHSSRESGLDRNDDGARCAALTIHEGNQEVGAERMDSTDSIVSRDSLSSCYTEATMLYSRQSTLDDIDDIPKTSERARPRLRKMYSVDMSSSSVESCSIVSSEPTQCTMLYSRQGTTDTIEEVEDEQDEEMTIPVCTSDIMTEEVPPSYSKAVSLDRLSFSSDSAGEKHLMALTPDSRMDLLEDTIFPNLSHELTASELLLNKMFYDEELEESEKFYKAQPRALLLFFALYNTLVARSEMLCFFVIILNHMVSASMITLVLPILIFLWAMLSVPRPSKRFWMTAIVYTEVTIVIKYFFQFGFFPWNENLSITRDKPDFPPNVIGIEKKEGYVHYDLIQLLALFFHRSILKCHGLWDEDEKNENASAKDDMEEDHLNESQRKNSIGSLKSINLQASMDSIHVHFPEQTTARRPSSTGSQISNRSSHRSQRGSISTRNSSSRKGSGSLSVQPKNKKELLFEKVREQMIKAKTIVIAKTLQIYIPIKHFFYNIIHPEYSAVTDVYVLMFLADVVDFIVIVFGFGAFGKHSAAADITSSLSEDQVPEAFLVMLIIQFGTMVVDRALYLRKTVLGKVIFQVILVFGIHFWMFFILPRVTERRFNQNKVAQVWYFVKCVYFGLSAYQIRCGYPTRVLGNFLTKSYNYINLFLFQGFRLVPFLTELRAVMDWVWTDTTLSLSSWICIEDIYAHIFILKCWRESEKRYPQPRGQKKKKVVKYGMGGLIVFLLICIVWFPLLFMSLIKSVAGVTNKPLDVSISITIGGYQPIFTMSAQQKQLQDFDQSQHNKLLNNFKDNPAAMQFLDAYMKEDILIAQLEGNSNSLWTISPPSRKKMIEELKDNVSKVFIVVSWSVQRNISLGGKSEIASDKISLEIQPEAKIALAAAVEGKNNSVKIENIFPNYIRAPSDSESKPVKQLYENDADYCELIVKLVQQGNCSSDHCQEWWTVNQSERFYRNDDKESLEIIVFSDKVSPPSLGFLAGYGIMGLYASVVLVIGKFVREFFSGISHDIMFEELPNVDRILKLCTDIFLVRETGELELEEDLYAKLIFLYRSPETMIKWTREKTK